MSVDERLRIGLSRNALSLEPDVDAFLATALARRRRSRRIRWAGATAGLVAAACAVTVLVLSAGWGGPRCVCRPRGRLDILRCRAGTVCR